MTWSSTSVLSSFLVSFSHLVLWIKEPRIFFYSRYFGKFSFAQKCSLLLWFKTICSVSQNKVRSNYSLFYSSIINKKFSKFNEHIFDT